MYGLFQMIAQNLFLQNRTVSIFLYLSSSWWVSTSQRNLGAKSPILEIIDSSSLIMTNPCQPEMPALTLQPGHLRGLVQEKIISYNWRKYLWTNYAIHLKHDILKQTTIAMTLVVRKDMVRMQQIVCAWICWERLTPKTHLFSIKWFWCLARIGNKTKQCLNMLTNHGKRHLSPSRKFRTRYHSW